MKSFYSPPYVTLYEMIEKKFIMSTDFKNLVGDFKYITPMEETYR